MEKKLIPFEEALRGTIKKGDEVIINALYPAENETVSLYPNETGYKDVQLFSREEDLKFFYAQKDGIPTFWGDATKTKLNLVGKTGATFGVTAINKACKPWTNLEMGLYSKAATADDYNYLRDNLKACHDLLFKPAWVGSLCVRTVGSYFLFGLHYVNNYGYVYGISLFNSLDVESNGSSYVRPAVFVHQPSKIMVDMEKSKDGVWVLVPNN